MRIQENFKKAYETFPTKELLARPPLIPGVDDDEEHIRIFLAERITKWLKLICHLPNRLPFCGPSSTKPMDAIFRTSGPFNDHISMLRSTRA